MLKELNHLQQQKQGLVLSCSSQRLQIQEDLERLEIVSDKLESGVRVASAAATKLRWVLPLLPLGGALSLLSRKKSINLDMVDQAKQPSSRKHSTKKFGKMGSFLWKALRPGGYGWALYKVLKSVRS
ncbi:MAG: hypothetical protein AAGA18_05320 [Verrucomicrobiota bacterium]